MSKKAAELKKAAEMGRKLVRDQYGRSSSVAEKWGFVVGAVFAGVLVPLSLVALVVVFL